MMSPIRVKARTARDTLPVMTRINFACTYTVDYNVKCLEFGDVHKDDLRTLQNHWTSAMSRSVDRIRRALAERSKREDSEAKRDDRPNKVSEVEMESEREREEITTKATEAALPTASSRSCASAG